jgi:hypothetical protein
VRGEFVWLWLAACSFTPPGSVETAGPDAPGVVEQPDAPIAPPLCTACPPNDKPDGAEPITTAGRIEATLANATDDLTASCGSTGGRDLFYELIVPEQQVVYVDTIDSAFDGVLSIHAGPCAQAPAQLACANDPCGGRTHAQLGRSLAAGTYCLVVDEGAAGGGDAVVLDVVFAGRDGTELAGAGPWSVAGTSCSGVDLDDPSCEPQNAGRGTAQDVMYWFTVCPGTHAVRASTCTNPGYDSIVYLKSDAGELACRDDGCASGTGSQMTSSATGNGLMMVIVDGWNGQCGAYSLTITP